jgi:hypothetical protein
MAGSATSGSARSTATIATFSISAASSAMTRRVRPRTRDCFGGFRHVGQISKRPWSSLGSGALHFAQQG